MTRARVEQVVLGLIAVFMLPAGAQAAFAPRSFFDDFPLGRSWIALGGDAYNDGRWLLLGGAAGGFARFLIGVSSLELIRDVTAIL